MLDHLLHKARALLTVLFVVAVLLHAVHDPALWAGIRRALPNSVTGPDAGTLLGVTVYTMLAVIGAVAWHTRHPARPLDRLPGRQAALPPAPRGS